MSSKIANERIGEYPTLVKWSDPQYRMKDNGKIEFLQGGFNPLRDYILEIDRILITGDVSNARVLRNLRADLDTISNDFNRHTAKRLEKEAYWKRLKEGFAVFVEEMSETCEGGEPTGKDIKRLARTYVLDMSGKQREVASLLRDWYRDKARKEARQ